jgi:DNA repair exonuclease SbcCD ATPase subunit
MAIKDLSANVFVFQRKVNDLKTGQQKLETINNQIATKRSEIKDKKIIYREYIELLKKFDDELSMKNSELESVKQELERASIDKIDQIKSNIKIEEDNAEVVRSKLNILRKELASMNDNRAVILHTIQEKKQNIINKDNIVSNLKGLEHKFKMYPAVLQAFSSTGIPNLIIQNVLDDLQIEANNLLSQLKPGLQLSFLIEKTRTDGTAADTLDIHYYINGKERLYDQLSGAMKLSVSFSLKLGISFLLQKMFGTSIKFFWWF